ncbi:hypothetical protein KUTeg_008392 [Tegillarca granosa]|uniref:RRM domain-containing protein n=1 Tax=Tegillarca granosa TaxID=220873 RepID=A0ABQ9FB76_TEGGR|nr:hypothetical protein KUTeg_008392 [Tegillarca granosa]
MIIIEIKYSPSYYRGLLSRVVYIKFAKASEAALALEEMNGRVIQGHPKPLKKYGDIDSVTIVSDRHTGENKGFGYVRFHRPYHAALAFEGCDPRHKRGFSEMGGREPLQQDFAPQFMMPDPSKNRVLSTATANSMGMAGKGMERVPYCSIPLPFPQPMRPEDTEVIQRLFIVCQPSGIQEKVLRDAFCRFGNLIDVYLLPAKNYGYAKFASKESAMRAIQTLHGQNLAGNRLKVLEAEPPRPHDDDEPSKKQRM